MSESTMSVRPVGTAPVSRGSKAKKHLTNVAITGACVATTAALTKKAPKHFTRQVFCPYTEAELAAANHATKGQLVNGVLGVYKSSKTLIGKLFENLGKKIFDPNNKIYGSAVEKLEHFATKNGIKDLTKAKSCAALLLTSGAIILGLIARGIYKAGKINGESK